MSLSHWTCMYRIRNVRLHLPVWRNPCAPISAGGRAACTDHAPIWKPTDARTREQKVSRTLHSQRQWTLPRFPGERRLVAADSFARLHLALRASGTGGSFSRIRVSFSDTLYCRFLDFLSLPLPRWISVFIRRHPFNVSLLYLPTSSRNKRLSFQFLYLVVYVLLSFQLYTSSSFLWISSLDYALDIPMSDFASSFSLNCQFHLISFSAFPSFLVFFCLWLSFL